MSNNKQTAGRKLQRWALPLLVALVVVAVFAVLRFVNNESRVTVREEVYQFSTDRRLEYGAGTTLLPGKYALILDTDEGQVDGDDTPLYATESDALYLARECSWIDPSSGREWYVRAFSRLELGDSGETWCDTGARNIRLDGGTVSDCAGTYLFLDTVELYINGRTMELSPLSFCSMAEGNIRVYNYAEDELYTTDHQTENIVIRSRRGYQIDLTTGIFTGLDGGYRLLVAAPKLLTDIEKR